MRRANLLVFAGSAIGLSACDQMHVRGGVLTHRGRPWWVPPMFGCAGVVIAHAARPFVKEPRPIAPRAVAFAAAYAATAFVDHPRAVAAALWATGLPRVKHDLPFALLLATTGPAVEVAVARTGAFAYTRPEKDVLPWLSGLYIHGAPLALAVSSRTSGSAAGRR
jgi:hypothetical protein